MDGPDRRRARGGLGTNQSASKHPWQPRFPLLGARSGFSLFKFSRPSSDEGVQVGAGAGTTTTTTMTEERWLVMGSGESMVGDGNTRGKWLLFLPNKRGSYERDTAPGAQLMDGPRQWKKTTVWGVCVWNVSPQTSVQASRSNPFVLDEIFRPRRLKKKGDRHPPADTRLASPDLPKQLCLPAKGPNHRAGGSPSCQHHAFALRLAGFADTKNWHAPCPSPRPSSYPELNNVTS